MIFQGLSVARNCLRPETGPLTIQILKENFCVISKKKFNDHYFMGGSGTGQKFSITIEF